MTCCSPGGASINRQYDYCLKFLLVGDSDVGKNEILNLLDTEKIETTAALYPTIAPKTTVILLEGKRVKLQLWDTSGQGRFATIMRSYSRGAQGILIVYDITNQWSFEGIRRWLKEVDEQAPGIPKILIGNRLHLEFKRQVYREHAESFAKKKNMEYFEISTLASFNICESLTELSRLVLIRNGMERLWPNNRVLSLQELCCRCIAPTLKTVHDIDRLALPSSLQCQLKSFADGDQLTAARTLRRHGAIVSAARYGGNSKRASSDVASTLSAVGSSVGAPSSSPFSQLTGIGRLTNRRRRATVALHCPTYGANNSEATDNFAKTPSKLENANSTGLNATCRPVTNFTKDRTVRRLRLNDRGDDDNRRSCAVM